MKVRRAVPADLMHCLGLMHRFNDKYYHVPLNLAKATHIAETIINDHVGFVSDGGFIGGFITPDLMRCQTALVELGWYAEDNSGMALLDAFLDYGRADPGIDETRICTMNTSAPSVGRALQRRGGELAETSYRFIL
jgi:hypothetical protein